MFVFPYDCLLNLPFFDILYCFETDDVFVWSLGYIGLRTSVLIDTLYYHASYLPACLIPDSQAMASLTVDIEPTLEAPTSGASTTGAPAPESLMKLPPELRSMVVSLNLLPARSYKTQNANDLFHSGNSPFLARGRFAYGRFLIKPFEPDTWKTLPLTQPSYMLTKNPEMRH